MAQRIEHKGNRGFSLVETLAVVAILVILLSLSAVAAAYYRDYLKITELDNAARDIYMAAENRAVLLDSNGQLDGALGVTTLAEGGPPSAPLVFIKDDAFSKTLLTAGAVDPALLNGEFYILYDPSSGGVTDVFYTEGPGIQDIDYALSIAGDRDKRMRPDSGPMLGYYGGKQEARKDYTPLPAPEVMVEVLNGDLLEVDVTFSVPSSALAVVGNNWIHTAKQTVKLTYGGSTITLLDLPLGHSGASPVARKHATRSSSDTYITYTWVLDALDTSVTGRHFRQLFGEKGETMAFGGDFTVTAEIELSAPDRRSTSASGSDSGNSLFAEHSGGTTARLENLRHLQNLDAETSRAGGKTSAVQLADIDCCGQEAREPYGLYEFKPIVNSDLLSFDGGWTTEEGENRRSELSNLRVTEAKKSGAGLFAEAKDGMTFTGVRLIGADISADGAPAAGALVGSAGSGSTFQDIRAVNARVSCSGGAAGGIAGIIASGAESSLTGCRVYWESDQENLRDLLGSSETKYLDQITGKLAGGLAGLLQGPSGQTKISGSLAASVIRGTERAGGLVGSASGTQVTLEGSYADNYLSGGSAAGLLGGLEGSGVISNCYAAGFIDMKTTDAAAGLALGAGQINASRVYSVMFFSSLPPEGKPSYMISESQEGGVFDHTYYLGSGEIDGSSGTARGRDYDTMSGRDFLTEMGGRYEFKGYRTDSVAQNTYPYNLQEKQNLTAYSFPGLKDLPHYGDWRAYFKEPSLVYYEQDSRGKIGFSGGNARELIGKLEEDENITVRADGYAVALMQKDLTEDSFTVTYTCLGADGKVVEPKPKVTYFKPGKAVPGGVELLEATWERTEGGEVKKDAYWLAPLPNDLVIGDRTSKDFFQYLRFELSVALDSTNHQIPSGEYFYNPHFAETVNPYVPSEEGKPFIDWDGSWAGKYTEGAPPYAPENAAEAIRQYITGALTGRSKAVSVSVRTPRHFFHLSRHEDYYHNQSLSLSFQQRLTLDGHQSVYTGYRNALPGGGGLLSYEQNERGFQIQTPIGTQAAPFLGSYNGNGLPIRRLAFELPKGDQSRVCAGLFGSSNGTLRNIAYSLDPSDPNKPEDPDAPLTGEPRSITFPSSERHTYLGTLVGLNRSNGKIINCAVDGVNFSSQIYTSEIYIGGLCGMNEGTIQNSAAEAAFLHVDASNYGKAFVGGLAGSNYGEIRLSYAVGRLAAEAAQENAPVYLGGFVGRNSGSVYHSYSAMHLRTDGVRAEAWGFCADPTSGRQSGTYYLNSGNFSYRGEDFLANYDEAQGGATPISYINLTADQSPVSGMVKVPPQTGQKEEDVFPYPTGVALNGTAHHYGGWPQALKLGSMGVYYWEELKIPGKPYSYHVSLLAVDPGERSEDPKSITKISTLSTAHDEGGEVTRFGYGIYHKNQENFGLILKDTPHPLLYSIGGGKGQPFDQDMYQNLEAAKKKPAPSSPDDLNRQVDEALAQLMAYELDEKGNTEFQFHSFHSFGLHGNADLADRKGAQGGLYPDSSPKTPNGTLTLEQGGTQQIKVTFALNPLFAGAPSVELPKDGRKWDCEDDVSLVTIEWDKSLSGDFPGSTANPYEVRSIDQLQLIDWNSVTRSVDTVLEKDGKDGRDADSFPYLSSEKNTRKYHWKQSYDLKGEREADGKYRTYTPIAEYYDTTNTNDKRGYLQGWFGGVYDGNSYVVENVDIQGHTSSCAGLFGLVYNGTLKNIVLYSSTGESFVRSYFDKNTSSQWYAIGALAGVAASHDENGKPGQTAVVNCAVSGYRIEAKTYTAKAVHTWGGVGVGGLLGLSNMSLSGCTSNTEILLENGTVANDNIRVGGLVGSCQGSIQDCYAGGSISLDQNSDIDISEKGIYIGGIVGGSYMKPLQVGSTQNLTVGFIDDPSGNTEEGKEEQEGNTAGWTNNKLVNCYSYVHLPKLEAHSKIKSLYVIGGTGEINPPGTTGDAHNHGLCIIENCYFLTSEVLKEYNGNLDTYLEAIKNRGAKTDVRSGKILAQDAGYVPGKNYNMSSKFDPVENITQFVCAETGNVKTIKYIPWPGNQTGLYYHKDLSQSPGIGLFQYEGTSGSNYWTYRFLGWLVDYSGSFWLYTTDSNYFNNVTGLSYEQLAGMQKSIPGKDPSLDIYQLLNTGKTEGDKDAAFFRRVTTVAEDGTPVPGKYSYPPADSPHLLDRDYPFPTILTKDQGKYHVHYGDWPLKGFQRRALDENGDPLFDEKGQPVCLGGSPIDIDLFANGSAPYREYLVLTDGIIGGGEWSFTWKNFTEAKDQIALVKTPPDAADSDKLPEKERGKTFLLHLTPQANGTDDLLITYKDPNGVLYQLTVTVHITADVTLRPSRLFMFPSDTVETEIRAADKAGRLLELENGRLTLKGSPICGSTGFLEAETTVAEAAGGRLPAIRFTSKIPLDAPELKENLSLGANANFGYTVTTENPEDPDKPFVAEYGGGSGGDIHVDIIQPWAGQEEAFLRFGKTGGETGQIVCTITFPDSLRIGEEGTLHFARTNGRNPSVNPMPTGQPKAAWTAAEGAISLTLTYPVESLEDLPDEAATVLIPLTLTSEQPEGQPKLIEEAEGQRHTLVLTVKKPETGTNASPAAEPAAQETEALLPDGEEEKRSVRRRALERKP